MNILLLMLSLYMACIVSTLPIISKPLENNPDHLTWDEPIFMAANTHRSDDKTRKIPKSIFITPNLNDSKENCPPDHKLGPDGKCYKTLKIDPLVILKTQIDALFKRNKTVTTEYDDYDYSEYAESTVSNTQGKYPIPMISLGFASESYQPQQTPFPILNRVTKDNSHNVPTTTVSFVPDRTTSNGVTGIPFFASTTGTNLGSEDHIGVSKYEYSIDAGTTSSLLASTANSAMTPMIVSSTGAITTSNYTQPFMSNDENATLSNQYISNAESIKLTTMNEEKNATKLDNIESETKIVDKSEENENESKSTETYIESETSTSNENDEFTTQTSTEPLSQNSVTKPKLGENSTDLLKLSLSPLSQRIPEIEDILDDFNDKHPHFLRTITNDTASIEKLLISPYAELPSLNDTLALSSQMATEQYEWIENDSLEIFTAENVEQFKIQPRLENTHLISDEELFSLENATISGSEDDKLLNIKLARGNQSQFILTTDDSTNQKQHDDSDNDNIDLRLAEESLFQPGNTMKNDIESNKVFNLNKPSQINERALNNTDFIVEYSISDYVTTEEPQNYDGIEGNTQTEYSIEPKPKTEQSMSIYSTFINRLKTQSSVDQNKDRSEQSTQQAVKQFEISTNDSPTIEPSHTLIIKQPPKQGNSMLSTVT